MWCRMRPTKNTMQGMQRGMKMPAWACGMSGWITVQKILKAAMPTDRESGVTNWMRLMTVVIPLMNTMMTIVMNGT